MAILDFHNHLIPGVDDGAQTVADSRAGLSAFAAEDVRTVIVSPHIAGSLTRKPRELAVRMRELDDGWERLCEIARTTEVRVERGVELLLDIPDPDLSDARLRLAGGKFVLVEFPFAMIPPQSGGAIKAIRDSGYLPVIAHPERYAGVQSELEILADWKGNGGYLQVTGTSLLGRYGETARTTALELLQRGWADYLCSDYHARGPVLVNDYKTFLEEADATEQARLLMETNPLRLLEGLQPLPVPPLPAQPQNVWRRVTAMFRA